jgi:hypothetical protein
VPRLNESAVAEQAKIMHLGGLTVGHRVLSCRVLCVVVVRILGAPGHEHPPTRHFPPTTESAAPMLDRCFGPRGELTDSLCDLLDALR